MTHVGHTLYLTEGIAGRTSEGEYASGNKILVYDLDTRIKEYLPISALHPRNIYYDDIHQTLVIENDGYSHQDFPWTLLDLKSGQEEILRFP